jgi:hypothetical protein
LAGSLPFAADLALPALRHLATIEGGRLLDTYGLRSGVNPVRGFFAHDYLGIDQGLLLIGLEHYRTGLVAQLTRRSAVMQRALANLGFGNSAAYALERSGPRSANAYVRIDTTDHLTQTVQVARSTSALAGDFLLELHPYGIDHHLNERFVDVDVAVNGTRLTTVRFNDRRGTGVVDVGSVYVPISRSALNLEANQVTLTWAGGERWIQLEDVELSGPTGRLGMQETWQVGQQDSSAGEFGSERALDDSCLVGDDAKRCERALNVVDEPATDLLFELSDVGAGRRLRLAAHETAEQAPVSVEVILNHALAGHVTLRSGEQAEVDLPPAILRQGWNHLILRHLGGAGAGEFIVWDAIRRGAPARCGAAVAAIH